MSSKCILLFITATPTRKANDVGLRVSFEHMKPFLKQHNG